MPWLNATTVIAVAACAVPAYGQSPPAAAPSEAPGDRAVPLPPVNVSASGGVTDGYQTLRSTSATRTDTPLRDTPQSVQVITKEAIRDLSMQSLQDALRYVPGAGYSQGENNRDNPVLRGQATNASLFLDGIRDDVQYFRDLYNIDRIETLLGPSAFAFGRGGGGGIINRVTRQADWTPLRQVTLQGGSYGNARGTMDVNQPINDAFSFRFLGMYEDSDSFRDGVSLRRYGINPTLTYRNSATTVRISYENFRDERTADRGQPSFRGRPFKADPSAFFGDPKNSPVHANANILNLFVEHAILNNLVIRNTARFATYDKFYQNIFASGAVNNAGNYQVSAYNNAQLRDNYYNQTDLVAGFDTGPVRHTLLAGVELGRQVTDNVRNTGFFTGVGPNVSSISVSAFSPRINVPVTFRGIATDASNHGTADTFATYIQDQAQLLSGLQLIAGVRFENFNTDFTNRRSGDRFNVTDNVFSPRVALVYKPVEPVSLYFAYSTTFLPRAGEQLASLTLSNQALQPEEFRNYEVGAKWDVRPALSLTAALFNLDRTNVAVADPNNPTRSILIDGTRTRGLELGYRGRVTDAWSILGGYTYSEGEINQDQSPTIRKGNTIPFLSKNVFSLWNRYDIQPNFGGYQPRIGAGLGIIHQSGYYAATDNAVRVPAFTRFDAAAYWNIKDGLAAQVFLENIGGARYYPVADNNNNISPGAPFSVRAALTASF